MPTLQATNTDLKTLLGDLIKFPTLAGDQPTNQAALDWVKYQLRQLPLTVHDYTSNGFPSVVFTTRATKRPKVLLVAHMDVVPGPLALFELKEMNGQLIGRGAYDMKLAIAIYMKLLLELGDTLPNYDLGVMLTCDEELTGEDGVGYLVDKIGWRPGLVLNLDATGNWKIEQMAKGFARYRFESTGVAGHASRPWAGQNAIAPLMAFVQELASHFPPEPCHDPLHAHDTINIGIINGGTVTNQIPGQATAEVDTRFMPGRTLDEMTGLVQEIVSHYPGITAAKLWGGSPIHPISDNEHARLMELLIVKIAGVKPEYILSHGASDSRFFAAHGIPTIMTGPPGGGHHADLEWVDAKGCEQMYRITHEFVRQTARGPEQNRLSGSL